MVTKELSLQKHITRLLSIEFGDSGVVTCPGNQVTVVMNLYNCEMNFGNILQQMHRVIEECYPERSENVSILIRDESGAFQNIMKIWKSV